ncbi:MAG: hypothetical protein JNK29_04745 [Anaerolineales bacterium]|nr:hypothetical protein [Anaerolineales bacterium]
MTNSQVTAGSIILRQWDRAYGLRETAEPFTSLNELYAHCLAVDAPEVIDRIIIQGHDAAGQLRVVTFVFQSITITPRPSE